MLKSVPKRAPRVPIRNGRDKAPVPIPWHEPGKRPRLSPRQGSRPSRNANRSDDSFGSCCRSLRATCNDEAKRREWAATLHDDGHYMNDGEDGHELQRSPLLLACDEEALWLLDSGASANVISRRQLSKHYPNSVIDKAPPREFITADGNRLVSEEEVTVPIQLPFGRMSVKARILEVEKPLLSVRQSAN